MEGEFSISNTIRKVKRKGSFKL